MNIPKTKLVLSYNICYQAMCNDGSGSALPLGNSCTYIIANKLTICAQNMADFLDGVPASVGHQNFDFVGIQEASKVQYLQAAAKNSLAKLTMIKSSSNATHGGHDMQMASFYNTSKYTLIDSHVSQFNSYKTERPFQILLLTENTSGENIAFINVHSPHGSSFNTNHPTEYYSGFEALSYDLSEAILTMDKFDAKVNYKIIMTGDFNETGWNHKSKLGMKWQPLKHAGVTTDVEISNIVYSCNKADGIWFRPDGQRGGDYVFASGNAANISVPSNYVYAPKDLSGTSKEIALKMKSIWQSDHLPVMAELT